MNHSHSLSNIILVLSSVVPTIWKKKSRFPFFVCFYFVTIVFIYLHAIQLWVFLKIFVGEGWNNSCAGWDIAINQSRLILTTETMTIPETTYELHCSTNIKCTCRISLKYLWLQIITCFRLHPNYRLWFIQYFSKTHIELKS